MVLWASHTGHLTRKTIEETIKTESIKLGPREVALTKRGDTAESGFFLENGQVIK